MEDGVFMPNTMLSDTTTTTIDHFNLMDELFFDGFLLETTDGSNFWHTFPTTLNLNSTSFCFPTSDTYISSTFNTNPHHESLIEKLPFTYRQMDEFPTQNHEPEPPVPTVIPLNQSANIQVENGKMNTRLKKKLVQAINNLQEYIRDKEVLIQIWIPVKRGSRQVLTTNNQPFSLNSSCKNLAQYRDVSRNYQFAADKDSKEFVGLPGRVFLNKLPEWTPDVRFFKKEEYPRVNHAQKYNVRGSLALPVFEQGSGNCLGVIEIVTTSHKVDYRPELENVCRALEAVDLKSSTVLSPPNVEDCNKPYQAALAEIRNVLKCVCDTHKLPLAQTWTPCMQEGKGACHHSDEKYVRCVSTLNSACYVADPQVSGFHEACSDHHLLKGEGIAGKAFLTNQPCFAEDITAFCKTEYPLAHHARIFNLCAAVAIRLRSTYTGRADFVLEFFLPLNCKDADSQRLMLDSLSSVIQQTCQSLRVVTEHELAQETSARLKVASSSPTEPSHDVSSWVMHVMDRQKKGKGVAVSMEERKEEFKVTTDWDRPELLDHNQLQQEFGVEESGKSGKFSFTTEHPSLGTRTSSERRRAKIEKNISLQVLRQYFAGSLKDAAKSIGVCPTTLKRICRQYGITRWPSRKIKKVGHSLKKLQVVIDSVQGAEGSIQLSSFYNNFPELGSPNVIGSTHLPTSKTSSHLQQVKAQGEASKSQSSSGSHSSNSSYCFSTGVKQPSFPVNDSSSGDGLSAERCDFGQEGAKLLLRSYDHKILSPLASTKTPPVPTNSSKGTFRIKATFGEEKIRLSLQPQWGFKDLRQEVLRRFNMDEGSSIDLKYVDDDAEWVLLTCDADLEECIDLHTSFKSRNIRISLNQAHQSGLGSSLGSNSQL